MFHTLLLSLQMWETHTQLPTHCVATVCKTSNNLIGPVYAYLLSLPYSCLSKQVTILTRTNSAARYEATTVMYTRLIFSSLVAIPRWTNK